MSWITNFLTSSIGRKLLMSLTGLFLILFLIVHLAGNFQLLKSDGGQAFNEYTLFMTTSPLIKVISYGNYIFILLHAVLGITIWLKNRKTKGKTSAVASKSADVTWASKNMALLGILIFAFLMLHMGDFWLKMKMNQTNMIDYGTGPIKDLYENVYNSYSQWWIVIAYLIGLTALSYHLWHGFASAFQTLGLNHRKYTPVIQFVGKAFAILVPLGFAIIPLYFKLFIVD
ncbi:MAG: succinate dehydrogenase cytochrome b subunit [Saprospiraceae bacterium]|nr:succinate dehydrogenase cytochrome b subunit [Saprospiraceae bacterium]HMS67251.1 succinate dehydrogenase cytochrome b subunit [Saprospiraceae bacterium]